MRNTFTNNNRLLLNVLNRYRPKHHQDKESKLRLVLRSIWQRWVIELNLSNDPQIWQTIDRLGNIWWHAYHPHLGCFATRESKTEILEWIDRRTTHQ